MDQAPKVSGVKQQGTQNERKRIRLMLLSENEREKQDASRPRSMTPEKHTINSQNVVFIGASHIFNAPEEDRPALKNQISSCLQEFASENQDKNNIYIVEGEIPTEEYIEQNQEDEKAIVLRAAKEKNAEYISGDPSRAQLYDMMQESEEFSELAEIKIESLGNFSKGDLTLLYFFFRDCNLESGISNKNINTICNIISKFDNFTFLNTAELKKVLDSYPQAINKEELIQKSLPLVQEIINQLSLVQTFFEENYNGQSPKDVVEDYDSSQDTENEPNLRKGINSIAAIVRRERDVFLVEQIQNQTSYGKNVVVVFGASHQTRTRPVLKSISQEE